MILCYFAVILLVNNISGSHIIFTARPTNISPVLTSTQKLRCSLKTGTSPDADGLTVHPPSTKTKPQHISHPDVLHVMSVIIYKFDNVTRTNKTIASVTPFDPASAENSNSREITVAGNTKLSARGEHAYLEVTRMSPNDKDAGTFICQVSALNHAKYPVLFMATQQITASEPTFTDFVQYVESNNKIIAELKQDVAALSLAIAQQNIQHIQTGFQQCEGTTPDTFASFPVPFNNTPKVVTALANLSKVRNFYSDVSVRAQVTHANTTGFLFNCHAGALAVNFTWIAISDRM